MLEAQRELCAEIFQKLMDVPCARLFLNPEHDLVTDQVEQPFSFEIIAAKLSRGVYSSPQMFLSNVRTLLSNFMSTETGFRRAASRYLYNYLEQILADRSPTLSPTGISMQKLEQAVSNMSSLVKPGPRPPPPPATGELGTCVFNEEPTEITPDVLKNDMALLGSSEVILKVVGFVISKQPECVLMDSSLHFDFGIMSPETRRDLHNYIRARLEELARGKL